MAPARAWVTLLTQPGYLPGVRALNRSLRLVGSAHPLVVMVTPGLDAASRAVLADEGALVREVAPISPDGGVREGYANARFGEVWTKLAAWGLVEHARVVVLDADMLVVAGMDELFEVDLPADGLAACHACRCNPARIPSYPPTWTPQGCFYTHCRGVDHVEQPDVVDSYLNGGLLVLDPDAGVLEAMLGELATLQDLSRYPFAEQDYLNERYRGRWQPLPWVYNALKTLPLQHPALWDLSAAKNVHYIIDKPWEDAPDPGDPYRALDHLWWDVADDLPVLSSAPS